MAKQSTTRNSDRKTKAKAPMAAASKAKSTPAKTKKMTSARTNEKNPASTSTNFSPEERERMIQYAAYHIAEKDGFKPGKETEYWRLAEEQILNLYKTQDSQSDIH